MKKLLLSAALWLGAVAAAIAQQTGVPYFPQVLPAGTVIGRSTSGAGPAEAIPFARLLPFITAGSATFTGNITAANLTANGTSTLTGAVSAGSSVTATGNLQSTTGAVYSSNNFIITSRLQLFTSADGAVVMTNIGGTGLTSLTLGVSGSASYPMFLTPGSSGTLQIKLGDGSAFSPIEAASITSKTAAGVVGHQFDTNGKQRVGANTAPALTSCGTSPTITGNDHAGVVTMGTGSPTGCVITFNVAYASAPICIVSWQAQALASQSYTVSTTAITLTQTGTSSNVARYICLAQSGG